MLGAEMEVRVEEGGEGVLSNSVQLGRKSSDVSLCGNKPKRQKSQTTLKYIWNSNMNHKPVWLHYSFKVASEMDT
ncbi:hypothetical protein T07_5466 [Trichinella nelsoni]|uniref:Uncharacterized protein n=1 Tax=Trichinella nelsoni TaxID=6336 RepID=A0A0V0RWR4_9BILA|nr:hypothetical protein T07_5466 [Trichinella nelsoni]